MSKVVPRFIEKYKTEIIPYMMKEFGYKNRMEIPKILAITVSAGFNDAKDDPKKIESIVNDVMKITGQKPVLTKSKKAISNFKIRQGDVVGLMVTLRSHKMYEFFDKFVSIVLPRVRDFQGVSRKSFDGRGNYSIGLKDQTVFQEVDYDTIDTVRGLQINFVTNTNIDKIALRLLELLGMPYVKN